jgi:predicted DNA-binding transcriptional regulator AlpA
MRDAAAEIELRIQALGLAVPCVVDARLKFDRDRFGNGAFKVLSVFPASAASSDVMHLIPGRLLEGSRRLINMNQIVDLFGVGDKTIKEYITARQFPPHIQLEGAAAGLWWLHEIEAWRDGRVRDENFQNYSYGGKRRPRRNEKAHLKPHIRKDDQIKDLKQALAKMQEQLAALTAAPAASQATASKR